MEAVDIFDADGNGRVTTAELREGLLLCCNPLEFGDVVDCKLKVRVIQQWLRNKIEPQIRKIQEMLFINEQAAEEREVAICKHLTNYLPRLPRLAIQRNKGEKEDDKQES